MSPTKDHQRAARYQRIQGEKGAANVAQSVQSLQKSSSASKGHEDVVVWAARKTG